MRLLIPVAGLVAAAIVQLPGTTASVAKGVSVPPPAVRVAPNGDDATCARGAGAPPCATIDRAYAVARLGDRVELAGGDYPAQIVTEKPGKLALADLPNVVVQPAPGARVRLADLQLGRDGATVGPRHLTISGLSDWEDPKAAGLGQECEWSALEGSFDVTWRGLKACNFYLRGVRSFKVSGGDWGPCLSTGADTDPCSNSKVDTTPALWTRDVVIEDARFHDYRIVPGSGAHLECLFIVGGHNITVRRSRFNRCAFFDIFLQYYGSLLYPRLGFSPFRGIAIENNFFGPPLLQDGRETEFALFFSIFRDDVYPWKNVSIVNNSFYRSTLSFNGENLDDTRYTFVDSLFQSNILLRNWKRCPPLKQGFNVYVNHGTQGLCAPTDRRATGFPYADPGSGDYHLTGGVAVDIVRRRGTRGSAGNGSEPRLDIDGQPRLWGLGTDAGADECRRALRKGKPAGACLRR